MKFLLDHCAGRRLAEHLRKLGHDAVEARDRASNLGDEELLEWAASDQRILVTMDKDFGALVFIRGARHAGLIRLPHVPTAQRIALMD